MVAGCFTGGGAGFIGANFVLDWLQEHDEPIVNIDKLTYAGNLESLASLQDDSRHTFVHADIGDTKVIPELLAKYQPRAVINLFEQLVVNTGRP
jgi:dTDP-glucose 4,6-dehydratase